MANEAKQDHVKSSHQQYCKIILLFMLFIYKPFISQGLHQLPSPLNARLNKTHYVALILYN